MAKFTDLTPIAGSSMTNSHVFAVSTATDTFQLSLDALEQSFTGLKARDTNGISLIGNTVTSGITVGDNGFVGIDNTNPTVSLHVGDYGGATHPEFRITGSTDARSVKSTIATSGVYWQTVKKANDTDYYLQVSEHDAAYTGVVNIDKDGNFGVFDGSEDLDNKFYVSGGDIKFESGTSGIVFDPGGAEIKTSVVGDILCFNKTNTDDIVLGNNILYVTNNVSSPSVGIGTTSPTSPLEVIGSDTIANFQNDTTSRTRVRISNNADIGWITLDGSKLNLGPNGALTSSNLVYDLSSKKLGVGATSIDNKLHVYSSSESRLAKFEAKYSNLSEVFQVNNFNNDEVTYTGPRSSLYTFGRSVGTGPSFTNNVSKWGVGLYDDGVGNSYEDVFVFRVDADISSNSSIKAKLDRDGNFDIKGSFSTDGSYAKGKFIQNYHTRCVAGDIYTNPFEESSFTSANASTNAENPFGIAAYSGSIQKIKIITADTSLSHFTAGGRFEISVVDASSGGVDEQLNCFSGVSSSALTSLPASGVVAQFNLEGVTGAGTVFTFSSFSGTASFGEGQLLQYRISQHDGSATDINCTIMSSILYTVA